MKKISILLFFLAAGICLSASARRISPVGVDSIDYNRHGDYMIFRMNLDFTPTEVQSNRAQVLTPLLVSAEGDTLALHPVGVYGRQRYINYLRNGRNPLGAPDEEMVRENQRPANLPYEQTVPWEDWMDDSKVILCRRLYGCTNCLLDEKFDSITDYFHIDPAIPQIVYFSAPAQEAKIETLEGEAFIDFVVDKTDIRPSYRNNVRELGKIQASIDTVLNDPDVRITGIWLKGFASPESPYKHNTDLAIGRTEALKHYVGQLYKFPADIITTDYEPEDWEGLRRAVERSNIDNKEGILAIIDSDMAPDAKEDKIKQTYPREYKFMLDNFYPALRHTNYRITYEINRFDDLNKIREVMRTRPSRLSLREFFLLGNAAEPGSQEFNDVYETAVRMYPDNEVANINAANAALQRKDYQTAALYLSRAGNSPEAIYARASLAFLLGDYDKAEQLMKEASDIEESQSTLNEIDRIRSHSNQETQPVILN